MPVLFDKVPAFGRYTSKSQPAGLGPRAAYLAGIIKIKLFPVTVSFWNQASNSATWREFPAPEYQQHALHFGQSPVGNRCCRRLHRRQLSSSFESTHVTGGIEAPQAFCAAFAPGFAIPAYATGACQDNHNGPLSFRISSACTCIAGSAATSSASSSSTVLPVTTTRSAATTHSSAAPPKIIESCAIVSSS
jgi:hypothetical protein